ncbi:hypothetical protein FOZ62_012179, partial [Perkinsus olseni]
EQVDHGRIVGLVSLDWRKAYDTVTLPVLRARLLEKPIHINLSAWIWAFLNGRRFFVEVQHSSSSTVRQHHGLPQGCILSPLLWIIYVDSLLRTLEDLTFPHTHPAYRLTGLAAYADDVCFWCSGNSQEEVDYKIMHTLTIIQQWATETGMALSEEKTALIYFRRRCLPRITPGTIHINDTVLEPQAVIRLLGLFFDAGLTGKAQVDHICTQARRRVSVIRRLYRTSTLTLRKLYNQYILWIFTTGSGMWPFGLSATNWSVLEGCYTHSAKAILGARRLSSPLK